jgi:hypothetical protein
MVLVFALGALDFSAAVILFLLKFFPSLKLPAIALALLIIIKSIIYFFDIASIVDIIAGIIIIVAAFGYYPLATYAIVIWLLQKGIRSFI